MVLDVCYLVVTSVWVREKQDEPKVLNYAIET